MLGSWQAKVTATFEEEIKNVTWDTKGFSVVKMMVLS